MVGRRRGGGAGLVAGLVLGVVAVGVPGTAGALPKDVPVDREVPVLGQAAVGALGQGEERPPTMVVSVHGVRRIQGATILYYSVGFAGDAPDPELLPVTDYGTGPDTYGTLQASAGATFMDTAAVIDVPHRRSYAALRTAAGRAVAAPPPVSEADRVRLSDRAVVQWVALAPIPEKLRTVDVLIGSAFVTGVAVGDGLLEPTVDDEAPVVGSGWPTIDTLAVGGARKDYTVKKLVEHVGKRKPSTPAPKSSPSASASPSPSASPS
ncbi:hypothetical protein [Phycicoccus flavus]|uniref:hypothetical protein n=1 Tax=Phycicoccus flavus TaxID=2502783 RepID=UPI000FEBB002|nr:hypothetical protein [Phycicoccus flavus]NHA69451.1 hypothetical protein [Phycicoccus flavus]